jgi:hypothetical protein
MPKGPSNRIIVEVPQELKRSLYAKLAMEGKTLKTWFLEQALRFTGQEPRKP